MVVVSRLSWAGPSDDADATERRGRVGPAFPEHVSRRTAVGLAAAAAASSSRYDGCLSSELRAADTATRTLNAAPPTSRRLAATCQFVAFGAPCSRVRRCRTVRATPRTGT